MFRPLEVQKEWHLAFMGRIETSKGVDLLPEVISRTRRGVPDLTAVITGEGTYRPALLSILKHSGLDECVTYLGVVGWDEIASILNRSRVFVYPSRNEPFGLPIVEAMTCEVPVVTSDVHGPREIITDGEDGVLVPPGDPVALARAIIGLLTNEGLRTRMGRKSRATTEDRFSLSHHVDALLEVYRSVL